MKHFTKGNIMSNISATFKTKQAAEHTLNKLENIGVNDSQISIIATDETRGKSFNMDENTKMPEGAAAGATIGGLAGTVLGALSTAAAMTIPGLNLVVAGGIVSALAGLGAGAVTGGLIGALTGLGIPEHEAKIYEDEIKNGSVLMVVDTENDEQHDRIEEIFNQEDAYNIAA